MKKNLFLPAVLIISFQLLATAQNISFVANGGDNFTKLRSHTYVFHGSYLDSVAGVEPYVTDGTSSGTFLLKDINPGAASSTTTINGWDFDRSFYRINDTLCVFAANDGDNNHGVELWRTNGTSSGTYMIADLTPGPASSRIFCSNELLNGQVFFNEATSGGCWITDGTALGTIKLTDSDWSLGLFRVGGGIAYFDVPIAAYKYALWRTDGTPGGTYELLADSSFSEDHAGSFLNNEFIFGGHDISHGLELWKSDGTVGGTTLLSDLNSGPHSSEPQNFYSFNGKLVFVAYQNDSTRVVWITDGTQGGTSPLLGSSVFYPGSYSNLAGVKDSSVFFQVNTNFWKLSNTDTFTFFSYLPSYYVNYAFANVPLLGVEGITYFVLNTNSVGVVEQSSVWVAFTDQNYQTAIELYLATLDDEGNAPIKTFFSLCDKIFWVVNSGDVGCCSNLMSTDVGLISSLTYYPSLESPQILLVDNEDIFLNATVESLSALYKLQICGPVAVQNISSLSSVSLFPNPNDGSFSLLLPAGVAAEQVSVIDMTGRCVYSKHRDEPETGTVNLHLENTPAGIYLLNVASGERHWQQVFVKQ